MKKFLGYTLIIFLLMLMVLVGGFWYVLYYYGRGLPNYFELKDYTPPVVSRLHAGDGRLLLELAHERRVFVPVEAIPPLVKNAFLSAEDKNFYNHHGIDPLSIIRATSTNVQQRLQGSSRRPVGASTITQQVAKNFFLTAEVSIDRKIKEAILAMRIEWALSKNRILELYLNEIYLGLRSYGVAIAAQNYFNKSMDELTIAEAAYLAGLPKAPNNYHPTRFPEAAKHRRDWVLGRMLEDGHISRAEYQTALQEPLKRVMRSPTEYTRADYFAEDVRRWLVQQYGENTVYQGGLSVRTSINPILQETADKVLRQALLNYDKARGGWRGAITNINTEKDKPFTYDNPFRDLGWQVATVIDVSNDAASLQIAGSGKGNMDLESVRWARARQANGSLGQVVRNVSQVLNVGDVIYVQRREDAETFYDLQQVPGVGGGLVALDPHTGRVLAMAGGFHYNASQFNRASQALRQPGSTFKPFVYIAGLEKGYNPSSVFMDAPVSLNLGRGQGVWRPTNYDNKYNGPTTLRVALERSMNLVTIRLAMAVGMRQVVDVARRFGIDDNLPVGVASAIGAGETTLLRMTAGYAMFVNGGKKITPSLIDLIQDRNGKTIYRHDTRFCEQCSSVSWQQQNVPYIADNREQITDAASAYQMVAMLEGVVQRGTGRSIAAVGKPLAGKTGTTNDYRDVWFIGFSPDLAVGVFLGYDEPRNLGRGVTGGSHAAPVFRDFMEIALKDAPATPFRVPPGIKLIRVNPTTGRAASAEDSRVIWEAFKEDDRIFSAPITPENNPLDDLGLPSVRGGSSQNNDSIGIEGIY